MLLTAFTVCKSFNVDEEDVGFLVNCLIRVVCVSINKMQDWRGNLVKSGKRKVCSTHGFILQARHLSHGKTLWSAAHNEVGKFLRFLIIKQARGINGRGDFFSGKIGNRKGT
jgi:hypothetical protein